MQHSLGLAYCAIRLARSKISPGTALSIKETSLLLLLLLLLVLLSLLTSSALLLAAAAPSKHADADDVADANLPDASLADANLPDANLAGLDADAAEQCEQPREEQHELQVVGSCGSLAGAAK
mmetsp:Transcript_8439/g.15630  ORF Transcript_8439/g.15630 Transcript_8439/m.15630 type:complete len:123 (+) Transcript_8439:424-792(+)